MLKLWSERAEIFPSVTPKGTYLAKASQLKYDNRTALGLSKDQLFASFNEAYTTDAKTFTNPKSLYTYFSLVVDMYDAGKFLLKSYSTCTMKSAKKLKMHQKLHQQRNAFLDEDGEPKTFTRKDVKLKSYNSYLKAYEKISSSIDTKLGSRTIVKILFRYTLEILKRSKTTVCGCNAP